MSTTSHVQRRAITTPQAPAAIGPYSQAIQCGNLLFISGQIAMDPTSGKVELFQGDVAKQCQLALNNLLAILEAAGLSRQHVVKTTVYLTNMSDFSYMNGVYADFFGTTRPARATVAVAQLPAGVAFEIDAIAMSAHDQT